MDISVAEFIRKLLNYMYNHFLSKWKNIHRNSLDLIFTILKMAYVTVEQLFKRRLGMQINAMTCSFQGNI
jgi:hypothetical protein